MATVVGIVSKRCLGIKARHRNQPKNKAVISLNNIVCVAMWYLVMYSNCFITYYQLMLHGYTIKICFVFSTV